MRTLLLSTAVLLSTACVDAPITPAHLQEDGQLRPQLEQKLRSAIPSSQTPRQATTLAVTGMLAQQVEGALEDSTAFPANVGTIHLHMRSEELREARAVLYVWSHGDLRQEQHGFLYPTQTFTLSTSQAIDPTQSGTWKVEVYALDSETEAGPLLYQRDFEILPRSRRH